MNRFAPAAAALLVCLYPASAAHARGFGGFRGGGFHYSYGGYHYGGYHYAGYGGYHSAAARVGGYRYDGVARDRIDPVRAVRPVASTPGGWRGAFDRTRFPTDLGLAHYSALGARGFHVSYWSRPYLDGRGRVIRTNFGYYHCFRPAWVAAHPACWRPALWRGDEFWRVTTWAALSDWCGYGGSPTYYDYGSNVVSHGGDVYRDGFSLGTSQAYARQAADLAGQGQAAAATPEQEWKALGVFALAQGDEKTSNNLFQLAVNKAGVIRGNYYAGLTDTTTPVYGQIDATTKRAAWTIGKAKDRVFEAGAANLTKAEAPVLVHVGTDQTQQLMLVRIDPPKDTKTGE
jgi:hypothetical protein